MVEVDLYACDGSSDVLECGDVPSRNKEIVLATERLSDDQKRMLEGPAGSHVRHQDSPVGCDLRNGRLHLLQGVVG